MTQLRGCDCELPGVFHSGVPGVLAEMENGRLKSHEAVERCDLCRRFPSDAAALARLVELGLADAPSGDVRSYTVHCFAVVRITFPGMLASNAEDAARRAMYRVDWDTHGPAAEVADEITGALVDIDGDEDDRRSVEFDCNLEEVRR